MEISNRNTVADRIIKKQLKENDLNLGERKS